MSKSNKFGDEPNKNSSSEKNENKEKLLDKIYQQSFISPVKNGATRFYLIFYLIVSMIAGFLAGFIQDLWFDNYYPTVYTFGTAVQKPKTEEVLDLNFLLKEKDNEFSQAMAQLKGKLVGFYQKKSGKVLDSLYLETDFLGTGLVMTSDGWILTSQAIAETKNLAVITDQKQILEPLTVVIDPFNQTALVKIEAQNLSPVKFADLDLVIPTQNLLVVRYTMQNHGSDILKTTISKFNYHDQVKGQDFVLSTEKIDHYLRIAEELELSYNGALILNERMEVVGLLFNSGRTKINLAIPSYYLNSTFNNFLASSGEVIRAKFGVNYVNLSEALGLSEEVTEGLTKGAVLLGDNTVDLPAIIDESPAEKAGFKAGDIILKVNGEEVDDKNSLTKLINDYSPGKEIVLLIRREGKDEEIKMVLGEL